MNRKSRILSFVLACIIFFGTVPISGTVHGSEENLVLNPGFETGGWPLNQNASIDTDIKHSGSNSAKITGSASAGYYGTGLIAVDPGKSYELSLWIKTEDVSALDGAFVQVQQIDENSGNLGLGSKRISTGGTQDWTNYKTTISSWNNETAFVRIYVRLAPDVTGTAWFDDVVFKPVIIEEPEETGENLVRDPGFETGEWQLKSNGTIDTEVKHSGNQSVKFADTVGYYATHLIEIDRNRSYDLSVWIKTENVSALDGAFVQVQQIDENSGNLGLGSKRISTGGTQDWTNYKITISSWNSETAFVRIYVRLAPDVTGTAWFDDVSFAPKAFELDISDDNPTGNIFTSDENIEVKLDLYNPADEQQNIDIVYKIRDYENSVIFEDLKKVEANAHAITNVSFNLNEAKKYGTYILDITAQNNVGEKISRQFPFSRVMRDNSDVLNENFGIHTRFAKYHAQEYKESMPLIAQTGTGWIRDEIYWGSVEKEKGIYTMPPNFEEYIDSARAHNLNVMVVLNGTSVYGPSPPDTEEGIEAYAKFCGYVADYLKGRVNHFEIWNEYNIKPHNSSPAIYAETIKRAYLEIKKANPDAFVVGGSTARIDLQWLKDVFDAGGYDYMDAVSVHPYSYPTPPDVPLLTNVQKVHDLIVQYGADKPVWASEYGYPTHTGSSTERESAWKLARAHVLASTNNVVDKIFWYNFDNVGVDITEQEQNFGLVRTITAKDIAYSAKEPYLSHNVAMSKLKDVVFVEELTNDNVRAFMFKKGNSSQDLLVVWAKNGPQDIGIATDSDTVIYSDLMGNPSTLHAIDGIISFTAGQEPIYLEGSFSDLTLTEPVFKTDEHVKEVSIGGSAVVHISANIGNIPEGAGITAELPLDWTLQGNTGIGAAEPLRLLVPENVQAGEYTIVFHVEENNRTVGIFNIKIAVLPVIASQAVPVLQQYGVWDDWNIGVELRNMFDVSISGELTLLSPIELFGGNTVFPFSDLLPGDHTTIMVPVAPVPADITIPLSYRIDVASDSQQYQFEYGRNIGFLAAVKAAQPPAIDGVIQAEEWQDSMQFDISRYRKLTADRIDDDDLSAKGWVKWDDDTLYIAIQVIDDVHNQSNKGTDIWKGDSIQLGIDTKRLDDKRKEDIEIGFALADDGTVQSWSWTMLGGADLGDLEDVDVMVVRNESDKATAYEIAIPWTQLIMVGDKPVAGDVIGFSMLVNDNDTGERKGYIEYMTGIGGAKGPQYYGDVLLIEGAETEAPQDTEPPSVPANVTATALSDSEVSLRWDASTDDTGVAGYKVYRGGVEIVTVTDSVYTDSGLLPSTTYEYAVAAYDAAGNESELSALVTVTTLAEEEEPESEPGTWPNWLPPLPPQHTVNLSNGVPTIRINEVKLLQELQRAGAEDTLPEMDLTALSGVDSDIRKLELSLHALKLLNEHGKGLELRNEGIRFVVSPGSIVTEGLEGLSDPLVITVRKESDKHAFAGLSPHSEVFSLSVESGGEPVSLNEPLRVVLDVDVDDARTSQKLAVYAYDEATGEWTFVGGVYDPDTNTISFDAEHDAAYAVLGYSNPFADVARVPWAQEAIDELAIKGIMKGTGTDTFAPGRAITRAEFVALMNRLLKLNEVEDSGQFADVEAGAWYAKAISTAFAAGIIQGDGARINPDSSITREEMAVILIRVMAIAQADGTTSGSITSSVEMIFADDADISQWAQAAVGNVAQLGLMTGKLSNRFDPQAKATRAEAAVVVYRMINLIELP